MINPVSITAQIKNITKVLKIKLIELELILILDVGATDSSKKDLYSLILYVDEIKSKYLL